MELWDPMTQLDNHQNTRLEGRRLVVIISMSAQPPWEMCTSHPFCKRGLGDSRPHSCQGVEPRLNWALPATKPWLPKALLRSSACHSLQLEAFCLGSNSLNLSFPTVSPVEPSQHYEEGSADKAALSCPRSPCLDSRSPQAMLHTRRGWHLSRNRSTLSKMAFTQPQPSLESGDTLSPGIWGAPAVSPGSHHDPEHTAGRTQFQ